MSWMDGSDAGAVARARAGEGDAFRLLVERHSHSIFRLAYRMTGNEPDAEDVVQETFLRAHRGLRRFEARANFGTWLYRIATNCALDLIRKRQRSDAGREALDASETELSERTLSLAATNPTPDRLVFSAEVQQKVAAALNRLSPKERAAFVLRHFEGKSIAEVSRVMGLRANAAKNNIFRAVQKLRRELQPLVSPTR